MAFESLDTSDIETKEFWIQATKLCRSIKSIDNANNFFEKDKKQNEK